MILRGLFITATDTGVGKTHVACGIAAELRRRGVNVGVMKPVETGCPVRKGMLAPKDALALQKASGCGDPLDLINPYRLRHPLAPAVAAQLEGASIRMSAIVAASRKLAKRHDVLLVEGAGGIMVPLTGRRLFLDLAADLALPVLIVARPGLGTINHTLLTISALRSRRIAVAGIVLNAATAARQGLAERTNPAVIERLSGAPVLGVLRHGENSFRGLVDRVFSAHRESGAACVGKQQCLVKSR